MRDALASTWQLYAIAWRTSRGRILLSTVLVLLEGLAWPVLALSMKGGVDAAVAHEHGSMIGYGAAIAVSAIGVLLLHHFSYVPYIETCDMVEVDLDAELIALANGSARIEHHERAEYADRIAVLRRELSTFDTGLTGLFTGLSLLVALVTTSVILAGVAPWLLLLPVAALPPVWTGQLAQRMVDRSKSYAATPLRQAEHFYKLATTAASAKELRVLRLRSEVVRRQSEQWEIASRILRTGQLRATYVSALGQLCFAAAYVGSVLFVLFQAAHGHEQVGDVVLVVTLAAQVNQQVSTGLDLLQKLQRVAYALTRLRWLRKLVAEQEPPAPDAPLPETIQRGIELCDVAFTYPGTAQPVLSDVNLRIKAGSTVAIVGENGAGKTTLVKLLCRFYDVSNGTISLDGVDITRFPLEEWRGRISAGFQDFVRFELTAQRTVGIGDLPRLDDEAAVLGALDRARATVVLERLEDGLATELGRGYSDGTELSGGQWQRLALGRAMMRELPLLLVLDEPTSALDAMAEHQLFEQYAVNARRVGEEAGAITVLVSHRFSTVSMADQILVVADGRIAEAGSHDELMRADGLYAELYSLHASAFE
ncbi:ABC transporter ATP-binding protein [Actinospica robiniae]|uniref:ABC transporter ATP-binding protein n=1 Tax=Actinospica robiniae TaxID=304901 RepID=UPI000426245E|nr:ABC transporter ATP-binding protein [Actinospica robiniae]